MADRVLVTGGDGFIGSHLVEALLRDGHPVTALAQYNSFGDIGWLKDCAPDIRKELSVVTGDIRDSGFVRHIMQGHDSVFHLAALIAIPHSYRSPDSYVQTNIVGTLNVLQAARDLNVSKVIHTSTSEVYGSAQFVPITEAHPLQGQSPYSATKIAADQLAYSFACSFETPVVTVRPFNTFGPRQSLRAVIPAIITQIAAGSRLLRLGALKPTRDFSYVNDTVRGFLSAWKSELPAGQVVNLGSNFEISIGDTVDQIADLMGAKVEIEADSDRFRPEDSEVERLWADNSLARELMGWEPEHQGRAGFRRALEKTIGWFKDPVNLTRYGQDSYVL